MAESGLQAVLRAHGMTASESRLAEYVVESVQAMEEGALIPAASELPASEVEVLRGGGFDVAGGPASGDDPVARVSAAYSALLATSLPIKAVAEAMGRNESRIRQRLLQRSLYGIRHGRGWLLPLFQFVVEEQAGEPRIRGVVPGVERVFPSLGPEVHPVSLWRWFATPSSELVADDGPDRPMSPREWLLSGRDPGAVAALARDL